MLDKISVRKEKQAKNIGSHLELFCLAEPNSAGNEAPEVNEGDSWTNFKRKRTVPQNPIGSTTVPATNLETMGCTTQTPRKYSS